MISSQSYIDRLKELQTLDYKNRPITPLKEPTFNVYLNKRQIEVPADFKNLATKSEHKAEVIWFTLDRYFDGQDLAQRKKKWGMQCTNANGEEMLLPADFIYIGDQNNPDNNEVLVTPEKDSADPVSKGTTLKLGWYIRYDLTKEAGPITISLRCFESDENKELIYNLVTEPVQLFIRNSLEITDSSENLHPPVDTLTELVETIEDLYRNEAGARYTYDGLDETTVPVIDDMVLTGGEKRYHSSADFKNISYQQLLNKPKIWVDGREYEIGGADKIEVTKIQVDNALNAESENPVQNKVLSVKLTSLDSVTSENSKAIADIQKTLEDLTVTPMNIYSFTANTYLFEKGYQTTRDDLIFSWKLSKVPKSLNINTQAVTNLQQEGSFTWPLAVENSTTFTLSANDGMSTATTELDVVFTNRVYYGVSSVPDQLNETFVKTLSSRLQTEREGSFTVDAGDGQYIYYAVPSEYGKCTFSYGGFVGGFKKVASNIQVENAYKKTEEYDVYQSDYPNLGDATIVVA